MGMEADLGRVVGARRAGSWRMRREVGLGLQLGAEGGLMSERFRRRASDAVVPLVCGEVTIPRTWAAEFALFNLADALIAMDREGAPAALSSGRALHGRNRGVRAGFGRAGTRSTLRGIARIRRRSGSTRGCWRTRSG